MKVHDSESKTLNQNTVMVFDYVSFGCCFFFLGGGVGGQIIQNHFLVTEMKCI